MKTHILEVVGSLRIGGQERIATSIIEYIDRDKYQVDYLIYDNVDNVNTSIITQCGGKIIVDRDVYSNRFSVVNKLAKIMKDNGPYDIVHAHGMFNNGYVMKAAKIAGVKCRISHAHSTNDGKNSLSIIYRLYKVLMRYYMLRYSTKLVACGTQAGNYLYGEKAFTKYGMLFPNRIDANKFRYNKDTRDRIRAEYGFCDKKVFIIVGHIIPLKNHTFAFNVFAKYHYENRNSVLLVLGDGELKEKMVTEATRLGLRDDILFLGNVNNVNEFMICADCLLMPSWYEGFPVTLVEAQASGLMCIVSDTITQEVDLSGLIRRCALNDIDQWLANMKISYSRNNLYNLIVSHNYDFGNYRQWLDSFYGKLQ